MRGYGSWCMGWREGERLPPGNNGGGGCLIILIVLVPLLLFSLIKTAAETGSGLPILFGVAIIMGLVKGMK